jgi:isopenicillin N synthase-like dioxygenase
VAGTSPTSDLSRIPLIEIGELVAGGPGDLVARGQLAVAQQIGRACRESGFFCGGPRVDHDLECRLIDLSRRFFAQDLETKLRIRMALGGRAWRGYFRAGEELASGRPDYKEGLYFGPS